MKRAVQNKASGREFGLGKGPSNDGTLGMLKCPFQSVPVIEHVTWTTTVPLSADSAKSTFGAQVNPLQSPDDVPGILNVDSSFIINGLLQCHMLCYGIGIHIFGEPISFTAEGNSYAYGSASGAIASPDVITQNDLAYNALGNSTVGIGTANTAVTPALLEWGFADWMAAWHMANAYEVNWWFNQRYTLLKEMLADVCYFGPYAECDGAGTSSVAAQQFFKQVNDDYTANLASTKVIQPINFRRIGSVNAGGTAGGNNTAVMRPTRDFDLADVTFGGLRNQGAAGCCNPFRKFTSPVFLEKGIPIGLQLQQVDDYHWSQMQRYLAVSEDGASVPASVPFSSVTALAGYSTAGAAGVTAAEQTLDQTPNLVTQQVNTSRELYKGGAFKVAFLLKGFEINDRAWLKHIDDAVKQGAVVNANAGQAQQGVGLVMGNL